MNEMATIRKFRSVGIVLIYKQYVNSEYCFEQGAGR